MEERAGQAERQQRARVGEEVDVQRVVQRLVKVREASEGDLEQGEQLLIGERRSVVGGARAAELVGGSRRVVSDVMIDT